MKPEDYKFYECRYFHDGSWWAVRISAKNYADAEARVSKLGNLQLQGELVMELRGHSAPIMARFITWFINLIQSIPAI